MATSSARGFQRNASCHSKGTLDADRQHRLQELPGWTWDPAADQWEEGFSRLLGYVERHGDARVPHSYTVDGYQLGPWVGTQRRNYAKGTLDADRQRRLEDLPGWTWDIYADKWEEGFRRLLGYVERHGDARVPRSYTVDGYSSARGFQRNATSTPRAPLTPIANADSQELPGWTWDPFADQWEEGFSRLLGYVERHGDARVTRSYTVDGYKLGKWVSRQRDMHTKGSLDADRQRRLQDLPGWTWKANAEDSQQRCEDSAPGEGAARSVQGGPVDRREIVGGEPSKHAASQS